VWKPSTKECRAISAKARPAAPAVGTRCSAPNDPSRRPCSRAARCSASTILDPYTTKDAADHGHADRTPSSRSLSFTAEPTPPGEWDRAMIDSAPSHGQTLPTPRSASASDADEAGRDVHARKTKKKLGERDGMVARPAAPVSFVPMRVTIRGASGDTSMTGIGSPGATPSGARSAQHELQYCVRGTPREQREERHRDRAARRTEARVGQKCRSSIGCSMCASHTKKAVSTTPPIAKA